MAGSILQIRLDMSRRLLHHHSRSAGPQLLAMDVETPSAPSPAVSAPAEAAFPVATSTMNSNCCKVSNWGAPPPPAAAAAVLLLRGGLVVPSPIVAAPPPRLPLAGGRALAAGCREVNALRLAGVVAFTLCSTGLVGADPVRGGNHRSRVRDMVCSSTVGISASKNGQPVSRQGFELTSINHVFKEASTMKS